MINIQLLYILVIVIGVLLKNIGRVITSITVVRFTVLITVLIYFGIIRMLKFVGIIRVNAPRCADTWAEDGVVPGRWPPEKRSY